MKQKAVTCGNRCANWGMCDWKLKRNTCQAKGSDHEEITVRETNLANCRY